MGQPVAGVGVLGLADRAQHVLAQRRGVGGAGQPGSGVGCQRRGQAPHPAGFGGDLGGDVVVEPAMAGRVGSDRCGRRGDRLGVGDHGWQWPRNRQPGADRGGQGGEDGLGIVGGQVPGRRRHEDLDARRGVELQTAPQHRAQRILAARGVRIMAQPYRQRGTQVRRRDWVGAGGGQCGADSRVERRRRHVGGPAGAARRPPWAVHQ
ncbi:hypothetical protein MHEC_48240 [Mycobacterium heckeshornense]|uniref:Uncharacterized protein n=1 Tax=Mycobacterium heckeshornense TaxID=110505 RepID=A0A7R7JJX5_9MYCO|nr:hypothetical protein MHEC_48240 [Mycobacterium heckeshornense]